MPMSQGRQYLGRVTRVPHRGDTYHYASVEPLVESNAAATEWSAPVTNAQTRFPRRGLVHWHDAPAQLQVGSLWQFAIDEHPDAERGDRPEQFQLAGPVEPIEVIDLRGWTDETTLRSAITSGGIELVPSPIARRSLLWLASGVCVGPLLLTSTADGQRWVLDAPEGHRDPARMPVWSIASDGFNRVTLEGDRWFLAPPLDLGRSVGIQNWSPDTQVARSILGRLRRMDAEVVKALGATDKLFREYLDRIEAGAIGTVDPAIERARADRLKGVRAAIERDATLLKEAADVLLQSDRVRGELDRQVQAERSRLLEEMHREVDASLELQREELARVEADLRHRRNQLAELDRVLREREEELEEKVASFDSEITSRLGEIARRPEAAFAEMAILRALLSPWSTPTPATEAASIAEPPAQDSGPVIVPSGRDIGRIDDLEALRRELGRRAMSSRTSIHAMVGLHAAFAAGTTPVLIGDRAYDLLKAYASAVAGGRLHWVPVGSSLLEPQDLLGRFDISVGRIVPHPAGIIDVVRDAAMSERLHVVVLEGFNRAPIEAYLLPILEAAAAGRQGDTTRTIPLASVALLSENDPYRGVSRVAWPPNVLLACLPTHGSVTLPVPVDAWRYLTVLDADDRERPKLPPSAGLDEAGCHTQIDATWWRTLGDPKPRDGCERDDETLERITGTLGLASSDAQTAQRIQRVLCGTGLPVEDALSVAIACVLIPRSRLSEKPFGDALRSLATVGPGWRAIREEAERLRA